MTSFLEGLRFRFSMATQLPNKFQLLSSVIITTQLFMTDAS